MMECLALIAPSATQHPLEGVIVKYREKIRTPRVGEC